MKRKFYTVSIVLFIFVLMLPGSGLAHDDEHQAKGEHGSSELSEEGSGMKLHSEKHSEYKEYSEYDKDGKSSGHVEEGGGMKMHSEKHGEYKERGEYEGQGRSSEHMEEGSGMR